jgi:chemotaxis protein methyltransferase CheR
VSLVENFDEVLLQQFMRLVAQRTGLHIRHQDREGFAKKIWSRIKALKFSLETYYRFLETNSPQSEQEWQELAPLITTGESYLFRDRGQFTILRDRLLPELIAKHRNIRTLRIWSAGCSTGEEPYSIAIVLKELITDIEKWNIFILGTDINPEAINKAQKGVYNAWSFRLVNPDIQKRHFQAGKEEWQLDQKIIKMVTFRCGNLVKDPFDSNSSDIYGLDLIICRNVFVYFESQAIAQVLKKFYHVLKPGGYLIAGHAEIQGQNLTAWQHRVFPESVIYQRGENSITSNGNDSQPYQSSVLGSQSHPKPQKINSSNRSSSPETKLTATSNWFPIPVPEPTTAPNPNPQVIWQEVEALFHKKDYAQALKKTEQLLNSHPRHFDAYSLCAQLHANLGEYDKAVQYCQQAIQINSLAAEPHYLLAHIAQEQGNIEAAKQLFKRAIYLNSAYILAYLHLGFIYETEGDETRAERMRITALKILQTLPPKSSVDQQTNLTAGELIVQVKKLLKTGV